MTQPDNSPLVSIIIPAYNTARYIYRAIQSSLNQTYSNIEILVIDDGSTDDTLRVARSYAENDSRIRVFTQENGGVSVARNKGISEASGEYFVFVDSDDWLENDAVEIMLDVQMRHPDRLVGVNAWLIYLDSNRKDIMLRTRHYDVPSRKLTVEETVHAQNEDGFPRATVMKIFNADIIRDNNLKFRVGVHYGEDQIFALEYLFMMKGSIYLDKPLYNILERHDSAMHLPFSEIAKRIKEHWCDIILNDTAISPELQQHFRLYAGKEYVYDLMSAITNGVSSENLQKYRQKARPFVRDILSSKRVGIARKIYTVYLTYFPIAMTRLIVPLYKMFKKDYSKKKMEVIPYW